MAKATVGGMPVTTALIGKSVEILYTNGMTDRGVVEAIEGPWIRFLKGSELLICSAHAVRLIKVHLPQCQDENDRLLRPAEP
jgi:hypothetical protein